MVQKQMVVVVLLSSWYWATRGGKKLNESSSSELPSWSWRLFVNIIMIMCRPTQEISEDSLGEYTKMHIHDWVFFLFVRFDVVSDGSCVRLLLNKEKRNIVGLLSHSVSVGIVR